MKTKKTTAAVGGWSLFLFSLLLYATPSMTFSLKNCTISYSENPSDMSVMCFNYSLVSIPDDIPRNSTTLDLGMNSISTINTTDLRNLSKLKFLCINNNMVFEVNDGSFADLEQLQTLLMDANQLTNLTDHMFEGLSSLILLSLQRNSISSISPVAFRSLSSLKTLQLKSNRLHQIRDIRTIFQILDLKDLSLSDNQLTSIQSQDLPFDTINITTLDLSQNPLRRFSITRDKFPHLQSLDFTKCTYNIEWDVANTTFLRSLTSLHLSGLQINLATYRVMINSTDSLQTLVMSSMGTGLAKHLVHVSCFKPSLRILKVQFCEIHSVDDNLLQPCYRLTELRITASQMSKMSEQSLSSMTRLRVLGLIGNWLPKVPLTVRGLSTLETLALNSNHITELNCLDFANMTKLKELDLEYNYIFRLQECVFQNLQNLRVLNIGKNSIFALENSFKVNMQKLEILNLRSNDAMSFKRGEFRNLSSLRFLDLQSKIRYIVYNNAFEGLDHLQALSVSTYRYKKELFHGLKHLQNLTLHLTFHWNWMRSGLNNDPPFSSLPNLKRLKLKVYNRLLFTHIYPDLLSGLDCLEDFSADNFFQKAVHPDTFKYTPHLQSLQIIYCELSVLPPELFHHIPKLQVLDLSKNNFRSLDFLAQSNLMELSQLIITENKLSIINETIFLMLPSLRYLDLMDNPLTCECTNAGFNLWVHYNTQTQVVNGYQYPCAFPVGEQGRKFLDFDAHSCWVDASFICFISTSSLIVFVLFTSLFYNSLRWHVVYAYYLFLAFLYDTKNRKRGVHYQYDAFISYNVQDEEWVYREMLPVLEGEQGWRLCLHHRDFEPGKPIVDNITDAIYGSRKTICVISRCYLQSEWCSREIQMASFRLFDEQKDVLVLVFLEDIPSWQLSPHHRMRKVLKKRTYLSWTRFAPQTGLFWQNLNRALRTGDKAPPSTAEVPPPRNTGKRS
uniref:TIR domain-containing protein n=1 Tax=Sphaeramia orbicularis TaxID=375764 RepID=A0A672YDG5_9TELE